MNLEEFKELLKTEKPDKILESHVLGGDPAHVSERQQAIIIEEIARHYGVQRNDVSIFVVGSAKLGFSLSEKRLSDGTVLPRYRSFRTESDIDVAVVAPSVFNKVWWELSLYSNNHTPRPWKSHRFGDYLVCGWIRPDHFPKARLRNCDAWANCFDRLSVRVDGRRKVRGALFSSLDHMRHYYIRSILACIEAEALSQ